MDGAIIVLVVALIAFILLCVRRKPINKPCVEQRMWSESVITGENFFTEPRLRFGIWHQRR